MVKHTLILIGFLIIISLLSCTNKANKEFASEYEGIILTSNSFSYRDIHLQIKDNKVFVNFLNNEGIRVTDTGKIILNDSIVKIKFKQAIGYLKKDNEKAILSFGDSIILKAILLRITNKNKDSLDYFSMKNPIIKSFFFK